MALQRPRGMLDALHTALTGERTRWGERGLRRPLDDLARRLGSHRAAARAAGVDKGTWWRWRTGRSRPRESSMRKVITARRRHVVDPDRLQRARQAADPGSGGGAAVSGGMVVRGTFLVSDDERHRRIDFGWHPLIGDAIDAWLAGDDQRTEQALSHAMGDIIGTAVEVTEPEIEFYGPDDDQ